MPIFPWQRTQRINVWRMVGGNMPSLTSLWLTVRVGYILRQIQRPRRVLEEHAECFLSIVRHTNAEQRYI